MTLPADSTPHSSFVATAFPNARLLLISIRTMAPGLAFPLAMRTIVSVLVSASFVPTCHSGSAVILPARITVVTTR